MISSRIAIFGEAEKGSFNHLFLIKSLYDLSVIYGEPPQNSRALHLAVQTILMEKELLFFRVHEEGFSAQDYFYGIQLLEKETKDSHLSAICMPGIGNKQIIEQTFELCEKRGSIFITTPQDLYDYLTDK
jgi:hypothetical protein